ncbi:hypothetical protein BD779DRAFT_1487123 [Infundibulicybe gibba]|nr:hypothetical protein BD779DRAFT_1487123 [Infundibulicybe gibba]
MTSNPTTQTITPKRASKMASNQVLNVNDLLNFTLPPRQSRPLTSLPRRSRKTNTQYGVWNKERFVNAQYRFVMNPMGDYTVHFADPDIFFQWHDILQVIIPRSSAMASAASNSLDEGHTSCPICLSPPAAPRMTKCGHVFCFPCILHYLSTSDNKWARCPICFDSVNEKQLKSVKWFDGPVGSSEINDPDSHGGASSSVADTDFETALREGSTMRMRLIQRPQITTLALPRSNTWPSDLLPPHQAPFHFLPDVFNFAKFMLATPGYLITDLTRDLDELAAERRALSTMHADLEMMFLEGAEEKVRMQVAKATALETPLLKAQIDKAIRDQSEIEQRFAILEKRRQEGVALHSSPSLGAPPEFLALKSTSTHPLPSTQHNTKPTSQNRNGPRQRRNLNPPPPSTSTYYYYQAASGLPIFLHPLDIKILLSHYTGYSAFPNTITIRVDSFAEGTVNDELRKRCKYLAHLPEGADVVFVEAALEGVVGTEGLKSFEGALKLRTSRRLEKGRKEDRARARAEERERERDMTPIAWSGTISSSPPYPPPDISERNDSPTENMVSPTPVAGAWGQRSFASALHAAPSTARAPARPAEDEWEVDWDELEQKTVGRRKRGARLVVLGGGSGGRRR